jgi:GNAT superfamily N-acetyltransferase
MSVVDPVQGTQGVRVRPGRPQDARAIAAIHVRSWRATYAGTLSPAALERLDIDRRAALWRRRLATPPPGQATLVAEVAGRPAGFLLLGPTPDADHDPTTTGHVLSVHVAPDVTGQGVGRALLEAAVQTLADTGHQDATLWVVVDNQRARRFYQRAGWTPDGVSRRQPLAVEGESGDEVTVVRYRRTLRHGG